MNNGIAIVVTASHSRASECGVVGGRDIDITIDIPGHDRYCGEVTLGHRDRNWELYGDIATGMSPELHPFVEAHEDLEAAIVEAARDAIESDQGEYTIQSDGAIFTWTEQGAAHRYPLKARTIDDAEAEVRGEVAKWDLATDWSIVTAPQVTIFGPDGERVWWGSIPIKA